jgi:hypothetical protein
MNSRTSIISGPMPASIEAMGQNIALVFAAAKESGQSEAVVREALQLLSHAANAMTTDTNSASAVIGQ